MENEFRNWESEWLAAANVFPCM